MDKPRDPITGPIPRDEFKRLAEMPYGKAIQAIRKYDPTFGLKDGEAIKWHVRVERMVRQEGYATVEAVSKEEAKNAVSYLDEAGFVWDIPDESWEDGFMVQSVTPAK